MRLPTCPLPPPQIIEDDKRERERVRAHELAVRERETQELLKSGIMANGGKKGTAKRGTVGNPAFNKALAQNVAAEKVEMYGKVGGWGAAGRGAGGGTGGGGAGGGAPDEGREPV